MFVPWKTVTSEPQVGVATGEAVVVDIDFIEPTDLAAALAALRDAAPDTHLVAGGAGLLRRVRMGAIRPSSFVSIGRLSELQGIVATGDGGLRLGAAVTLSAIGRSSVARERAPLLAEICAETRTPQFRSLATLGGVLAGASPLDEPLVALVALGASVRVVSPVGTRVVTVDDLVGDSGESRLASGEILMDIHLTWPPSALVAYERVVRREGIEPPLIGCAVSLAIEESGICRDARVVLGVATLRPTRLRVVEGEILGRHVTSDLFRSVAGLAGEIALREDVRASERYLRRLVPVVVERALKKASGAMVTGATTNDENGKNEVTA